MLDFNYEIYVDCDERVESVWGNLAHIDPEVREELIKCSPHEKKLHIKHIDKVIKEKAKGKKKGY